VIITPCSASVLCLSIRAIDVNATAHRTREIAILVCKYLQIASWRTSPSFGQYQILLFDDWGTGIVCEQLTQCRSWQCNGRESRSTPRIGRNPSFLLPVGTILKTGTNPYSWPCSTYDGVSQHNPPTYGSRKGGYDLGGLPNPSTNPTS